MQRVLCQVVKLVASGHTLTLRKVLVRPTYRHHPGSARWSTKGHYNESKVLTSMSAKSKQARYFRNQSSTTLPSTSTAWIKSFSTAAYTVLEYIEQGLQQGQGIHGASIYTGTAGVAYMYLRVAESLQNSQHSVAAQHVDQPLGKLQPKALLSNAQQLLQAAPSPARSHSQRITFLEGHSGSLALQVALSSLLGDHTQAKQLMQELLELAPQVLNMPPTECEVLYGRCGYIYSLLFAQKYLGADAETSGLIKQLLQQVVVSGQRGAAELRTMSPDSKWSLTWSWHGSYYLGGAHGVCGILLVMMHCQKELEELYPGQASSMILYTLNSLLKQRTPSGNLLSSLGSESDKYVQWCHGAPSLIPVLVKAYELLGNSTPAETEAKEQILAAARQAADVVWERGLLTKGCGLCHGISGNAYSFLSLYHVTNDELMLQRAQHFGLFMVDYWQELAHVPDTPLSMYEGLGGAVCLWMDLLSPQQPAPFPGYEL